MFERLLQSQFVSNMVQGWIRHGAAVAVPALIAAGVLQQNQANDFMGAVIFLGAVAWSGVEKYLAKQKVASAMAVKGRL